MGITGFVVTVWAIASLLPPVQSLTDVRMKALMMSCDSHIYQPMEMHNALTKCQRKIHISLLINTTGKASRGTGYIHVTQVYEPEYERSSRLLSTIVIRLRQDHLLLAYPLRYLATANGKVTENVKAAKSCNLSICDSRAISLKEPKGYCCNCNGNSNCTVHCLGYSKFWYFVCMLGHPVIKQTSYIKLYARTQRAEQQLHWQRLMEPSEELVLSAEHPEDSNNLDTVTASFLSEKAREGDFVLKNYKRLRVVIPCPPPGVPLVQLPPVYADGSDNILLVPNNVSKFSDISSCLNDTSSYKTGNHCHPLYYRCFEEQPHDIFQREEAKRKLGQSSPVLLSSYRNLLPEAPILHNATSDERFLSFLYSQPHVSLILLEINADNLTLLRESAKGRISVVSSRSTDSEAYLRIQVANMGVTQAIFTVQATQCTHGVANSDTDSAMLTPQQSAILLLKVHFGALDIRKDISCTVELHDSEFGMIASRLVTLRPTKLCHCYLSCQCSCAWEKVDCQLMDKADAAKAGVYKSRTARASSGTDFLDGYGIVVVVVVTLLIAGLLKAFFGFVGWKTVGRFGIHSCLYGKRRLQRYYEPDISKYPVQHDFEGYPVHPKTKLRTRVIGYGTEFMLNTFFFFIWPFLICRARVSRRSTPSYCLRKSVRASTLKTDGDEYRGRDADPAAAAESNDDIKGSEY